MSDNLKRTPLYDRHVKLGAKIIPFAGFEMPVQYRVGVVGEHRAVRERAGLFDVSHMGEFTLVGQDAESFVNYVIANDVTKLEIGQALYSVMCLEDGGIVDDLLVYRFPDRFRLVVNAANIEKDYAWIEGQLARRRGDVQLEDESDRIALLAIQGPESEAILTRLTDLDTGTIGYYRFAEGRVADEACVVSRTGYTGEDGFELYCGPSVAPKIWDALLEEGGDDLEPVGLGARDTLRLEMGYALYGNDIDEKTTPLEAGLGWTVKLDKGEFVGRQALQERKAEGLTRRLCGFILEDRGFPRPGYEIRVAGQSAGSVRSGTVGPSVGRGIGTGYLPLESAAPGTEVEVMIRDRAVPGKVAKMPFYTEGSLRR